MRSFRLFGILGFGVMTSFPNCIAIGTPLKNFQLTCPDFWYENNGLLGRCKGKNGMISSSIASINLDYCVEWNGTYLEPKHE